MNQLSREVGEPLRPASRKSPLDEDVLTLDPAEVLQPLQEWLDEGLCGLASGPAEPAYARNFSGRLRPCGERCGEEAARQGAEKYPPRGQGITSSGLLRCGPASS
jgi:hypothetical protein